MSRLSEGSFVIKSFSCGMHLIAGVHQIEDGPKQTQHCQSTLGKGQQGDR